MRNPALSGCLDINHGYGESENGWSSITVFGVSPFGKLSGQDLVFCFFRRKPLEDGKRQDLTLVVQSGWTQPKAGEVRYGRALSVLIAVEALMLLIKAQSLGSGDRRVYMEAMAGVMAGAACGAELLASSAEAAAQRAGTGAQGGRILQGNRKLWAASLGTVGGVVLAVYDFGDFWDARGQGQGTLATAYLARGLAGIGLGGASSLLAVASAGAFFEHFAKTSTNKRAQAFAKAGARLATWLSAEGAQKWLTRVLVGSNTAFWVATGVWYLVTPDALEAWCDKSAFRKNDGEGFDDLSTELSEFWQAVAKVA